MSPSTKWGVFTWTQGPVPQPLVESYEAGLPWALFFLKRHQSGEESGFPGASDGKESACNAGDPGSIRGSGRSPGEGNGHPLQYSGLENPVDREAQWATVHGVAKSWTQLRD